MRFFRLAQDQRPATGPIISNLGCRGVGKAILGDLSELDELTVLPAKNLHAEHFSYLDRQVCMFREAVRDAIGLYEPELICKSFCLLDSEQDIQVYYHAPVLPSESVLPGEGGVAAHRDQPLQLDSRKLMLVRDAHIFRLREAADVVIISLPLAESLLRRRFDHITITNI